MDHPDITIHDLESFAEATAMKNQVTVTLCTLFALCISMAAQTQSEPALKTLAMPRYPRIAVQGRVQGIVKVAFTLQPHAEEPTNVELVSGPSTSRYSGPQLLIDAALENVKTWRFANSEAVERRYEVTFEFGFSAKQVVTFQSFHYVTVEFAEPPIIAN